MEAKQKIGRFDDRAAPCFHIAMKNYVRSCNELSADVDADEIHRLPLHGRVVARVQRRFQRPRKNFLWVRSYNGDKFRSPWLSIGVLLCRPETKPKDIFELCGR